MHELIWPELMRFKRTFTDPVPEEREKSFAKAGVDSFHGVARFTSPSQLQVGEEIIESRRFLNNGRSQTAEVEYSGGAIPDHK